MGLFINRGNELFIKIFNLKDMRKLIILLAWLSVPMSIVFAQKANHTVNLSGNSYVVYGNDGAKISDDGLINWTGDKSKINTYVYFSKSQTVSITIKGKLDNGNSKIKFTANKKNKIIELEEGIFEKSVGKVVVKQAGYIPLSLEGLSKTSEQYAQVESFIIESDDNKMVYVHDFVDYWGRRGPSVHLSYDMPEETIEWFYNEVTVPENNDVLASYYMANGFAEGYYGMQVNSPTERRILFSVWSPFDTQDPKLIPDSLKIKMLRKGKDVHIGEFGNEGSGGQSYLRYNWKTGTTYKFLTQIKPSEDGSTIYTSYFYATDENKWLLIASFSRPQTDTYYKRAHSFLENFSPGQGYINRKVYFGNQWYRSKSGKWIAGKNSSFTNDATAQAGVRLDYKGGYDKEENKFFLQNSGFFSDSTPFGEKFTLEPSFNEPNIDFELLENL